MLALLAGIGWESLAARLPRPARSAIIVLPLLLFVQGFDRFDRSRFYMAEEFATIVLESLPPDATLSASEDNILFPLMYVHMVEGMRPDVTLLMQGVGQQGQAPGVSVLEAGPLHFTHHPNWKKPDVDVIPVGLTFAARRRGTPKPAILLPPDQLEGESDPRVPKDYLTQNLIGHFHYMQGLTFERVNWQLASEDFALAAASAVDDEVLFYNLGRVYSRNGRIDDAVAAFERFAEIYPRHAAVPSVLETVRTMREGGD
jgi:tetratricopeptide (TPR) repeat protein